MPGELLQGEATAKAPGLLYSPTNFFIDAQATSFNTFESQRSTLYSPEMPVARTFPIEPDVMVWARERLGLSPAQAADALRISVDELEAIERGQVAPRVSLLETAASKYHVSLLTLLAPRRPNSFRKPKDFRTIGGYSPAFSPATLQAIYEVQYYRHEMRNLIEELEEAGESPLPDLPRATTQDDPELSAAQLRSSLGVTAPEQLAWSGASTAFAHWRWSVELQGIFVLVRKMPRSDCKGFSLWDEGLPTTIVVNSAETSQARQFTLFHEYAHILLRTPAICIEREDVDNRSDERWCNQFAASVLMPRQLVVSIAEEMFSGQLASMAWAVDDVERLARRLKVGRPAAAIRLEELGLAPGGTADRLVAHWNAEWEEDVWTEQPETEESPKELKIPMAVRRISALGAAMPQLVFHGLEAGVIDQGDASHLLDTGSKHFPAMRELLARRREAYA